MNDEFDHLGTQENQRLQQDLEFASYLDYMVIKLKSFDDEYMTRLAAFKVTISNKLNDYELNVAERARRDTEYIQRQTRTEVLWKGLRRVVMLRRSEKSGRQLPST